jgi:hypothetical protein
MKKNLPIQAPSQTRRRWLALLGLLPSLSACEGVILGLSHKLADLTDDGSGELWVKTAVSHPPFFKGEIADWETRRVPYGLRIKQRAGEIFLDNFELLDLAIKPMVEQAIKLGYLKPTDKCVPGAALSNSSQRCFGDQVSHGLTRLFLVSVEPNVVLLVPHPYKMMAAQGGGSAKQLRDDPSFLHSKWKLPPQEGVAMIALMNLGNISAPRVGLDSYLEVSSAFPDVKGIRVLSDRWSGARTLTEMEAESLVSFRVEPAPNKPGFARLVLKSAPPSVTAPAPGR